MPHLPFNKKFICKGKATSLEKLCIHPLKMSIISKQTNKVIFSVLLINYFKYKVKKLLMDYIKKY